MSDSLLFLLQVVLSACSSYFQSLFLQHSDPHPIVILKDVRFAELQTLVEFMYKGEVNVQYCQLPALLKTAESLKVPSPLTPLPTKLLTNFLSLSLSCLFSFTSG